MKLKAIPKKSERKLKVDVNLSDRVSEEGAPMIPFSANSFA